MYFPDEIILRKAILAWRASTAERSKPRRRPVAAALGGLLNPPKMLTVPVFNSFAGVKGRQGEAIRAHSGPIHKANTQWLGHK